MSIGDDSAGAATAIASTDIGKVNSEMAKVGLPGATLVSIVVSENPLRFHDLWPSPLKTSEMTAQKMRSKTKI